MAKDSNVTLRDVLDIKEDAHAGDFKIELSHGFGDTSAGSVADYVVTDQLAKEFDNALRLVRGAVRKNTSYAAYLHGSFGSGKSHFLTVLHAVLNGDPAARAKPRLREVVGEHDDWLPGKKFLMVPYHLVGAADLDSALLGGYVRTVRAKHPTAPTPAVYKADSLLADARSMKEALGADAFARLLPAAVPSAPSAPAVDDDEGLAPIGAVSAAPWTGAELDAALAAPAGDERRARLVTALLSGPMKSYATGKAGEANAFVPLDDGLSEISKHARTLGYDGVVLFLDELILWLQARMNDRTWVNEQIQQLVKLIESGNAERPVPIVSFISRQRDLSQLVGKDILGSDVQNMEDALRYLQERFTVINLEDRNLPEIIKERVLRPRPGQEEALERAFAGIDRSNQQVKDVLLDDRGATNADWDDFRAVYPLSPALLNVLVALSGALQRERSGLKLVQQLLEKNADAPLGRLIPLGDLWDVLVDGTGAAFTDRLKHESENAVKFHDKARQYLLEQYGSEDHPDFLADARFTKTLMLAALAPDVPALRRLTGARLAALNHGSVRSRTVPPGTKVADRMKALQARFHSELLAEGETDPVFSLHLSDLDIDPLLDAVAGEDKRGPRRVWLRDRLWELCGVKEGQLVAEKDIVWRGTRRTVEFVFGNVRDPRELTDDHFTPSENGRIRFVVGYPWDEDPSRFPADSYQRVEKLRNDGLKAPTLVWLPDFFSEQRKAQLGQLMRINFLLERNRLDEYTRTYAPDDRAKARRQLELSRDNLTHDLVRSLGEVFGISAPRDGTAATKVVDGRHVLSLLPEFPRPAPEGGKPFEDNVLHLADGMFGALHPKHPDFGPDRHGRRTPVTQAELRTALEWITRAVDEDGRVEVGTKDLPAVKRIVEPLELGTVHDGPLVLRHDWRIRINQAAAQHQQHDHLTVEDIRRWITGEPLGHSGLDPQVTNLLIAAYALLDDRAWVLHSGQERTAPELQGIGPGWGLRSQLLPDDAEYATARERAAHLFGVSSKPRPYARNVNRLAEEVGAKAKEFETNVAGVQEVLKRHAVLLGLDTGTTAPRTALLREAAGLLARLAGHDNDATGLVKELAAAAYETPDRDLAHAMGSAGKVLAELDATDWPMLGRVHGLRDRDDSVGDRTVRLFARIAETVRAPEYERSLVTALKEARTAAAEILDAALRTERTPPPPSVPDPGPGQISLTEHGTPPVPSQPHPPLPHPLPPQPGAGTAEGTAGTDTTGAPAGTTTGARPGRRVIGPGPSGLQELLAAELTAVRQEIEEFRAGNPGTAVEITWRPVHHAEQPGGGHTPGSGDGTAPEPGGHH
ncbi:hypothetical protein [Streptomyces sp. HB2AG]|uniref:hypothetical protein n=1 Tax=Streptomyces sp. HB2AG TaxID=2983400 RepID=UPI0022AA0A0D|nr:hypothetical protein [Streptomyces sp. HB2AG]MCZ2526977.1 hypothetical protein [Streptomyces sp. HB2AG]